MYIAIKLQDNRWCNGAKVFNDLTNHIKDETCWNILRENFEKIF